MRICLVCLCLCFLSAPCVARERFEKCVHDVVPELAYIVGDVRTPDGIGEDIKKIANHVMGTMNAIRRLTVSNVEGTDKLFDLASKTDPNTALAELKCNEMRAYANQKVPFGACKLPHARPPPLVPLWYHVCACVAPCFVSLLQIGLGEVDILEGMIVATVYFQLGKISVWREQLQDIIEECSSVSDLRILFAALSTDQCYSRFLPSFQHLQPLAKELVIKAFESDFILGQFGQLECVPGSMVELQRIATQENGRQALHFGLFMQLLGISGSGGGIFKGHHVAFHENIEVIEKLADGQTPIQVYDSYIGSLVVKMEITQRLAEKRADLERTFSKVSKDFLSFDDFAAALQKALLRLVRMLRYHDAKDLGPLLAAALEMTPQSLSDLVKELNLNGINDGWAILLMYSPSLIQNLANDKESESEMKLDKRLLLGLRCLHRLYTIVRTYLKLEVEGGVPWGGGRDRGGSLGSDASAHESETSAGSGKITEPQLGENGVCEVNCYQVATWAKKSKVLETIIKYHKRTIVLEPSFIKGRLAEGNFTVKNIE